jgi:hypothetical protein
VSEATLTGWDIWDWANWASAHYPRGITSRVLHAISVRANRETLSTALSQKYIAAIVYALELDDVEKWQTDKVSQAVRLLENDGLIIVHRKAFYLAKHDVYVNRYTLQIADASEHPVEGGLPEDETRANLLRVEVEDPQLGGLAARNGGHNSQKSTARLKQPAPLDPSGTDLGASPQTPPPGDSYIDHKRQQELEEAEERQRWHETMPSSDALLDRALKAGVLREARFGGVHDRSDNYSPSVPREEWKTRLENPLWGPDVLARVKAVEATCA